MTFASKASKLWAKSDPPHPLWCHLIDVGAVTESLWDHVLTPAARVRLGRGIGVSDIGVARAWVIWLAALHDIGKAEPGFQGCDKCMAKRLTPTDLNPEGATKKWHHGAYTHKILKKILTERNSNEDAATNLARAIGAHHGEVLGAPSDCESGQSDPRAEAQNEAYANARAALVAAVEEAFGVAETVGDATALKPDYALLHELAGFVSYADWIGSNTAYFSSPGKAAAQFEGVVPVGEYAAEAREQAVRALRELGIRPLPPSCNPSWDVFARDISSPFVPNALQAEVASVLAENPGCRFLLIEAPMGEGKTEAALYAASHWIRAFGQPGAYLGLPTQATSNAMLMRVDRWLARLFASEPVESLLVHGALVHPEYYARKKEATYAWEQARLQEWDKAAEPMSGGDGEPGRPPATTAHDWFFASKRALIAPFGTGTIDQALLGAIFVRHSFVRLAGLAGKTVIFDEVHAYDTYTSQLILRLLEYLAALDCTVVLLSATLPATKRRELANAFLGSSRAEETTPAHAYPRISFAGPDGGGARAGFGVSRRGKKILRVESAPWELADALAEFERQLGGRGCGAFLVNTVAEAQEAYRRLQEKGFGAGGDQLLLFHSRFTAADRARIEQEVLDLFGRDGARRPSGRAILVATQVVEQSLDLDFDLMMSTLAPIDLLLQRSGRLHRHDRPDRPAAHRAPRLLVRMPEGPTYDSTGKIYGDAILLRTHAVLRTILKGSHEIIIPADIPRLIESVYEGTGDDAVPREWSIALKKANHARRREEIEIQSSADAVAIFEPTRALEFWEVGEDLVVEEDSSEVARATRYGEDTVRAVVVREDVVPVGEALKNPGAVRALLESVCPMPRSVKAGHLSTVGGWAAPRTRWGEPLQARDIAELQRRAPHTRG